MTESVQGPEPTSQEWSAALVRVLEGKPQENGEYLHLVYCSGDRHQPPGAPGITCVCRPSGSAAVQGPERLAALLREAANGEAQASWAKMAEWLLAHGVSLPDSGDAPRPAAAQEETT